MFSSLTSATYNPSMSLLNTGRKSLRLQFLNFSTAQYTIYLLDQTGSLKRRQVGFVKELTFLPLTWHTSSLKISPRGFAGSGKGLIIVPHFSNVKMQMKIFLSDQEKEARMSNSHLTFPPGYNTKTMASPQSKLCKSMFISILIYWVSQTYSCQLHTFPSIHPARLS